MRKSIQSISWILNLIRQLNSIDWRPSFKWMKLTELNGIHGLDWLIAAFLINVTVRAEWLLAGWLNSWIAVLARAIQEWIQFQQPAKTSSHFSKYKLKANQQAATNQINAESFNQSKINCWRQQLIVDLMIEFQH